MTDRDTASISHLSLSESGGVAVHIEIYVQSEKGNQVHANVPPVVIGVSQDVDQIDQSSTYI